MSKKHEGNASGPGIEGPTTEVPDGGAIAWLQVTGAFCINLTTW